MENRDRKEEKMRRRKRENQKRRGLKKGRSRGDKRKKERTSEVENWVRKRRREVRGGDASPSQSDAPRLIIHFSNQLSVIRAVSVRRSGSAVFSSDRNQLLPLPADAPRRVQDSDLSNGLQKEPRFSLSSGSGLNKITQAEFLASLRGALTDGGSFTQTLPSFGRINNVLWRREGPELRVR